MANKTHTRIVTSNGIYIEGRLYDSLHLAFHQGKKVKCEKGTGRDGATVISVFDQDNKFLCHAHQVAVFSDTLEEDHAA